MSSLRAAPVSYKTPGLNHGESECVEASADPFVLESVQLLDTISGSGETMKEIKEAA